MRALLDSVGAEEIQWPLGGFRDISEASLLRSRLHGCRDAQGRSNQKSICSTCAKDCTEGCMRVVFNNGASVDPSQRSKLEEQRDLEFADPMQFVSYVGASCARGYSSGATEAALHLLRQDKLSDWFMQHLSDEDQATWRSTCDETRARMLVSAALSVYIGRNRAARLKCVGNGVVALQAAYAFVILAERSGIFKC
jgi:hypothetical protein